MQDGPMKIEAYTFGRIDVGGRSHSSDLILYPEHIQEEWWRRRGHYLQVEDLAGLKHASFDVLVIGTGAHGAMRVAEEVEEWLDRLGVAWEKHRTEQACDRYNALLSEGKRVIAALHLTC